MTESNRFQDEIYVQIYHDDSDPLSDCLMAHTDKADVLDCDLGDGIPGDRVGVYKYVKTITMSKKVTVKYTQEEIK